MSCGPTGAARPREDGRTRSTTTVKATRAGTAGGRAGAGKKADEAAARVEAKARAKAEEQHRREVLAQVQRAAKDADSALAKASKAEGEQQTRVRHLHEQLTDARRRLDEIRIDLRRAENRQRKAQHALERHQK